MDNGMVLLGIVAIVALVVVVAIVFGRNVLLNWQHGKSKGSFSALHPEDQTSLNTRSGKR